MMKRKIILSLAILSLFAMSILALLVHQASPGPDSQDILGVTLGRSDNYDTYIAFLSGRRLDCVPEAEPPYTSTCTVTIAGKPLTIQAYRNEPPHLNQLGGGCEAIYNGQTWPCQISSRHVHVHWFAHIPDPLGLDTVQMDGLRRQYFIENLPEEPFLASIWIAPILVTTLVLILLFTWRYPPRKLTWITAVPLALFTFFGTLTFTLFLTNGFWD